MMDSQDNILEQEVKEEVNQEVTAPEVETPEVAPVAEEEAPAAEEVALVSEEEAPAAEEEQPRKVYETKKEVLDRIKEIAHGDENPQKEEIDYLKTSFYKLHIAEREANLKAYIDGGGDPEAYQITPDEDEEVFKAEMGIIKEKRAKLFKEQEAEKLVNLEKKLAIIEKIKSMITSPEEANKAYQEFKALQAEWREIKNVPAEKANELWRNYQLYVEQFYDLLKLNSEAREYDFKKNFGLKTKLCEAAEKLADELCDAVSYIHSKQVIHRDLKPSNILVTHNGNTVKLIDYGFSDSDAHSVLKISAGTAVYTAPEVLKGEEANVRSDIYSLGLILSQISRSFRRVARKCCEPRPWRRYASAAEVKKAIHSRWPLFSGLLFILAVTAIVLLPYVSKWLPREEEVPVVPADTAVVATPADTAKPVSHAPVRPSAPVKKKEGKPAREETVDEAAIDELFRQATELFD